jgi:hypothetical protein
MKTPRDVLLAHHRAAEVKLDAARADVLATEFNVGQASRLSPIKNARKSETGATPVLLLLWRELIFPSRRVWAGLAAVWIGIFAVNFSQHDPSPVVAVKASSPQMMLTFRQQERLLAELTGPGEPSVAEPPKNKTTAPRPRSERDFEILTT